MNLEKPQNHPATVNENANNNWQQDLDEYFATFPEQNGVFYSDTLSFFLDKGYSEEQLLELMRGRYVALNGTFDPLKLTDGTDIKTHIGTVVNDNQPLYIELQNGNILISNHLWEEKTFESYYSCFSTDFPFNEVISSPKFQVLMENTQFNLTEESLFYTTQTKASYINGETHFSTVQLDNEIPIQSVNLTNFHTDPKSRSYFFRWDWEGKLFWKHTGQELELNQMPKSIKFDAGVCLMYPRSYEAFLEHNAIMKYTVNLDFIPYAVATNYEQLQKCYKGLPTYEEIQLEGYELLTVSRTAPTESTAANCTALFVDKGSSNTTIELVEVKLGENTEGYSIISTETHIGRKQGNEIIFKCELLPYQSHALSEYLDTKHATSTLNQSPNLPLTSKAVSQLPINNASSKALTILQMQHPAHNVKAHHARRAHTPAQMPPAPAPAQQKHTL